jgi:two-component system, cell cycle response regulator CtrA
MRLLLACDAAARPPIDMLQRAGVACDVLAGLRSVHAAGSGGYDLILLATGTGEAALSAVTALREDGSALPAMVLAGSLADGEEEALLDAGADEVLCEATPPARLLARLRATARRSPPATPPGGNLVVDPVRRIAEVDGRHLALTGSEFDLLGALLARPGRLRSKAACQEALYQAGAEPSSRTVDVFICRLRRKLAAVGADVAIRTVWGRGYVLERLAAGRALPAE